MLRSPHSSLPLHHISGGPAILAEGRRPAGRACLLACHAYIGGVGRRRSCSSDDGRPARHLVATCTRTAAKNPLETLDQGEMERERRV